MLKKILGTHICYMKRRSLGLKLHMYYSKHSQCLVTTAQPKLAYVTFPKIYHFGDVILVYSCNIIDLVLAFY